MPYTHAWTDKELAKVAAAVKKADSRDSALYNAQKATPTRKLTLAALDNALRRGGHPGGVGALIARPKIEAVKPEKKVADDLVEMKLRGELTASEADRKELLKQLADLQKQFDQMKQLAATKPLKPVVAPKRVGAKQRRGCPVMVISDLHVEERVDPKAVNGLNEYNLEIADRRVDELADAFEWMMRDPRFDCREAVISLLGDLFSGYIHEELAEANFLSPVQAVAWILPRLERLIRKVLAMRPTIERLLIPCNDGNHGRTTHKIRVQTRTANSLEWLLYYQLAARLSDEPRVQFQIADGEYNVLQVFDQKLCFFHGDSVKYIGGVGGLLVPLKRGLNELRKSIPADVYILGHFHRATFDSDVVVNGSMIGTTAYSLRNKFEPQKPQQVWWMQDATIGKTLQAKIPFKGT